MSLQKSDGLSRDSIDVGAGMILFGKRWLVVEMDYKSHSDHEGMDVGMVLVPWESIDPTMYRIKPKLRRNAKEGKQP